MTCIHLTNNEISEINNIICCLKSKDEETFKLGIGLLKSMFNYNTLIPYGDMLFPIGKYIDNISFNHTLNLFSFPTCLTDNNSYIDILKMATISKCYVIL